MIPHHDFDIPAGFTARPDGRLGWILERAPPRIRYPCSCGHDRETMVNKKKTQVHVLPCYSCNRWDYETMRRKIEAGVI